MDRFNRSLRKFARGRFNPVVGCASCQHEGPCGAHDTTYLPHGGQIDPLVVEHTETFADLPLCPVEGVQWVEPHLEAWVQTPVRGYFTTYMGTKLPLTTLNCWYCHDVVNSGDNGSASRVNGDSKYGYEPIHETCIDVMHQEREAEEALYIAVMDVHEAAELDGLGEILSPSLRIAPYVKFNKGGWPYGVMSSFMRTWQEPILEWLLEESTTFRAPRFLNEQDGTCIRVSDGMRSRRFGALS